MDLSCLKLPCFLKDGLLRLCPAEYQENGQAPVAPSAIAIEHGQVYAPKSGKMADYPVPRALDIEEIPGIIQQAVRGARNAISAGKKAFPGCNQD